MNQTIYADGISNLSLVDGVVRYDLINILSNDNKLATAKSVATIAMSLPALLRTYESLSGVINKMIEQGFLTKTEAQTEVKNDISIDSDSSLNQN
jgi:hypothetical protein